MSVKSLAVAAMVVALACWAPAQEDCTQYDQDFGPSFGGHGDPGHHLVGEHQSSFGGLRSCNYYGNAGSPCSVNAEAWESSPTYEETPGSILDTYPLGYHVGNSNVATGDSVATNGQSASAHALGAVSFMYCLVPSCAFGLTITGSGSTGYSVQFPAGQVWGDQWPQDIACAGRTAPPVVGGGCQGPNCGPSPLIFDLANVGIENLFSNAESDCVLFDINGDGKPLCIAWPYDGKGGWLVLPDKNGQVTSILQLFGSHTPQPNHRSRTPNGFNALAEWDLIQNGGNLDTMISKVDEAWSGLHGRQRLKVWVDTHCRQNPGVPCTADPSDLHSLEQYGIQNISLMYGPCEVNNDKYNNQFWFCSHVNVKANKLQEADTDLRIIFDAYPQVRK